ncbi:hypothetical protein NQ317_007895 [Molorchus minor]|uniref:Gustatory receptor n=1 Tax=Molorchus minor TaxID=1323400 RepID=A0ABQ9JSR3_9CUCU|nr:hypothetical protein NQ317_007895 [Molorchus minor]
MYCLDDKSLNNFKCQNCSNQKRSLVSIRFLGRTQMSTQNLHTTVHSRGQSLVFYSHIMATIHSGDLRHSPTARVANITLSHLILSTKKLLVVSKTYKCYALFLNSLMIFGYCYALYGKLKKEIFNDYLVTLTVIEYLTNAFLNMVNLSAVTLTVFYYSDSLKDILNGLETFDAFTKTVSGIGKKQVWVILIILHFVVIGFLVVDTLQWLSFVHFRVVKYYMPRNIFTYNFCMVVNLMIFLVSEIETRFKTLNTILTVELNRYKDLKSIGKLHNFLCQVVDHFNGIYGFVILATVIFTITIIVNYTGLLMAFTVFRIELDMSNDQINLLYVSFFWILGALAQVSIFATRCHSLALEADKITDICHTFLNSIPTFPTTENLQNLKEELTLLVGQATQRKPRISAAGFFEVNHDMCGFILSTVTSYIIVVIQFLAKERERYENK